MAAVRARSAATRLLMLQLHSVSNGPSGEPAAPTAEFILALRLELVIAYQVSGDYSSASVTV